jgi:hypothetical protein
MEYLILVYLLLELFFPLGVNVIDYKGLQEFRYLQALDVVLIEVLH